jgi:PAS domain S-box-containing protein
MKQRIDEGARDQERWRGVLAELTGQLRQALDGGLQADGPLETPGAPGELGELVGAINELLHRARGLRTHADAAMAERDALDGSLTEMEGRLAEQAQDRERTLRELKQQRSVLRHVVDSLPYCVFWRDREGTYLGANQNKLRALGLASQDQIVGKTAYETGISREEADFYRQIDKLVMDSGQPIFNLEETQRRADGEHTLLVSKVPLRDEDGQVIGIVGMYVDVTERRHIPPDLPGFADRRSDRRSEESSGP